MANVAVYDMAHNQVGEISLNDAFFNVEMNAGLLHQAVVLQLASQRLGTHATKTRGLVRGGGRKPWRQKGTGRARAGSTRVLDEGSGEAPERLRCGCKEPLHHGGRSGERGAFDEQYSGCKSHYGKWNQCL